MVTSLQKLGHEVPFADPDCKVQIHFSQPEWYEFSDNQYKIGYTPWESSGLPDNWVSDMNRCDEIWTTAPIVKEWYEEAGVKPKIYVYEHGVDKIWKPKHRVIKNRPLRFLHVGEPAPRKGAQMALDAFIAAFGKSHDVSLTIKAHNYSTVRARDSYGSILGAPQDIYPNVRLINAELRIEQLIDLFVDHDVLVYPSYGEGFGLIPAQALGTGMPTICTEAWAPYAHWLLPEMRLNSTLGESPWQEMHPGKLFFPSFDHLVEIYRDTYENFNERSAQAFRNAVPFHQEYDWLTKTEQAFEHIVKKFG